MSGTVIVKLKKPHAFDGKECTELTMRQPLIGDEVKAAKFSQVKEERETYLMAKLCGVKHEDFQKMPLSNYEGFTDAYNSFFREDDESTQTSDTASSSSQE